MANPESSPGQELLSSTEKAIYKPPFTHDQRNFWVKVENVKGKFSDITDISQVQGKLKTIIGDRNIASLSRHQQERYMPEIFALAGRAIELATGMAPYDTQYVTARALVHGKIAQLPSGEGKTLATGIATVFKALTKGSVHVVTANDYLARRDLSELGKVYEAFGLKSGVIFGEGKDVLRFNGDQAGEDPANFPNLQRIPFNDKEPWQAHQQIYDCPIIYGTVKSLIFDEHIDQRMRDSESLDPEYQRRTRIGPDGKRIPIKKVSLIADEVDDLAIDKARTPQILSDTQELTPQEIYHIRIANNIAQTLTPPTYSGKKDKKGQAIFESGDYEIVGMTEVGDIPSERPWVKINDRGWSKILAAYKMSSQEFFRADNIDPQLIQNAVLVNAVAKSDKGIPELEVYRRDRDYIVIPDKEKPGQLRLILVDNEGRPLPDNILSGGLHQALEAKEGFPTIHGDTITFASTTVQTFLRSYEDFSGTTGTAKQSEKIFHKFYKKNVEVIPPHNPLRLKTWNTEIHFANKIHSADDNMQRAIGEILHNAIAHSQNRFEGQIHIQPFLIAADDDGQAELLFDYLQNDEGIKTYLDNTVGGPIHLQILNSKNTAEEAQAFAQAGKENTITISTSIAGRGVHIEPGGRKPSRDGKLLPKDSPEYRKWQEDHDIVVGRYEDPNDNGLGGLFVIAATIPSTQRELEQLKRRTARNGDPGSFMIVASRQTPLITEYQHAMIQLLTRRRANKPTEKYIDASPRNLDRMILEIQQKNEDRYGDELEMLVHIDEPTNHNRIVFDHEQEQLYLHTDEWLAEIPDILKKEVHQRLKFLHHLTTEDTLDQDQLEKRVNEALNIKDEYGDTQYQIPLVTVAQIDEDIRRLEQKQNAHFARFFQMSAEEQEKVVLQFLLHRYKENMKNAEQWIPIIQLSAKNRFRNFWPSHLEELSELQQQVSNERFPFDRFAFEANTILSQHLSNIELSLIALIT